MSRKLILPLVLLCFCLPVVGQNVGDQPSAGFTNARTYANVDVPTLRPPLRLFETVSLPGVTNATSLAVFEGQFLVGQPGSPVTYKLVNRQGNEVWSQTLVGSASAFRYVPAFSSSIVILGGESTASVKAVNVLNGSVLWSDAVGDTSGRFPAVTDSYAIYAGSTRIVGKTLAGTTFFQENLTTAASALVVRDDSLYFLTKSRILRAVNLPTASPKWTMENVAGDGASLIATQKYVFVNDPSSGVIGALNAVNGQVIWSRSDLPGTFATAPALALAYGRLFVFRSDNGSGDAAVSVFDANTGDPVWTITEPDEGISSAFIADNAIYYYNAGQVRVRDAATGALLWSIAKSDVRGLTGVNGELYILRDNAIDVYGPTNEIFMAQMANGLGQTTLVMLANPSSKPVEAVVDFFGEDGSPVAVPLETFGSESQVELLIPANSSVGIQTLDEGGSLISGWVRVLSDAPLRGMTDFQFTEGDEIMREAGVADALPIGSANVFINVGDGFNAGVAIANPTEQDAEVTFRLLNSSGNEVGSDTVTVGAGGHMAQFVNEVFKDEVGTAFKGTLVIESDVPVVLTAIRTKGGVQISSYPVGQAVR